MSKFQLRSQEEVDAFWLDSAGNKRCTTCEIHKPLSEFGNCKSGRYGKMYNCRECHNSRCRILHSERRANNPEHKQEQRNYYCLREYGITSKEYDEKLNNQHNRCKICWIEIEGKSAHLDHNHTTGKLRDFLCTNCNRGLGHFKENKSFLKRAVAYLESHNEEC